MPTGQITHVEFPADDPARAKRFYGAVAGWEFSEMPGLEDYWLFRTGEGTGGAIGKRGVTTGSVIRNFIEVASLEEATEAASQNGGTIVAGKTEVEGQGWYAIVLDTEGNEIALWQNP